MTNRIINLNSNDSSIARYPKRPPAAKLNLIVGCMILVAMALAGCGSGTADEDTPYFFLASHDRNKFVPVLVFQYDHFYNVESIEPWDHYLERRRKSGNTDCYWPYNCGGRPLSVGSTDFQTDEEPIYIRGISPKQLDTICNRSGTARFATGTGALEITRQGSDVVTLRYLSWDNENDWVEREVIVSSVG